MKRSSATALSAALVVMASLIAVPSYAATGEWPAREAPDPTKFEHVVVPFSGGVTLDQAEKLASGRSAVVGYRVENDQVVGEYFSASGQSAADYLAGFRDLYGTEPRIAGLVIERPKTEQNARSAPAAPAAIQTGRPDFKPAAVPAGKKAKLAAATPEQSAAAASGGAVALAANGWKPYSVYSKTKRSGVHQYFDMTMSWTGATSPANIPVAFGLEAGVDLYNGAGGTRGSVVPGYICGPNFRDQFIAKNYNWYSWSTFSPNGDLSSAYPYADLNDLFDSCGRNAMTIGFEYPQRFAGDSFGMYEVSTHIDAQIGVTSSSKLGGGIQQVDNGNCVPGVSLTDCMGTKQLPGDSRLTLSTDRGWIADPNKCWTSSSYGDVAPTAVTCP
jgi:hypothetical protein